MYMDAMIPCPHKKAFCFLIDNDFHYHYTINISYCQVFSEKTAPDDHAEDGPFSPFFIGITRED